MNLLWTPHNLASLGALGAQIPTAPTPGRLRASTHPSSGHACKHASLEWPGGHMRPSTGPRLLRLPYSRSLLATGHSRDTKSMPSTSLSLEGLVTCCLAPLIHGIRPRHLDPERHARHPEERGRDRDAPALHTKQLTKPAGVCTGTRPRVVLGKGRISQLSRCQRTPPPCHGLTTLCEDQV